VKPGLEDTLAAPSPSPEPKTATVQGRKDVIASATGLSCGQQLGHFRIEHRIGAGGMGEVYLATDLALDRPVAVKVLPESTATDPKRRDRLVREARAQARVAHPNVAHMYFIGEEAGRLFFAMELIHGKTLADAIAKGPMTVDDALSVIRAAALGLREASREGFTHRDVKPSNLMLDNHGMVKLLDFGLAAGEPGVAIDGPVAQTSLAGTPLYMAPEQARGEAVDLRADIYALGATLYHLISGKPPFQADSVDQLISMHATSARPAVPRKGIPRTQIGAVDALISRMMAAKPADRFADYDELLRAIELASAAQTRPGGLWARTFAMGIDFVVITLVMAAAFGILGKIFAVDWYDEAIQFTGMLVYYTVFTARWGRTLGKAIFELEVVDVVTTKKPALAKCTRRALVMYGLPFIAGYVQVVVETFTDYRIYSQVMAASIGVMVAFGVLSLLHASARVSGKRAPWDRIAGTMVRYRTTRTAAK
jgi:uncharacterized RDD family membrane protein YckC